LLCRLLLGRALGCRPSFGRLLRRRSLRRGASRRARRCCTLRRGPRCSCGLIGGLLRLGVLYERRGTLARVRADRGHRQVHRRCDLQERRNGARPDRREARCARRPHCSQHLQGNVRAAGHHCDPGDHHQGDQCSEPEASGGQRLQRRTAGDANRPDTRNGDERNGGDPLARHEGRTRIARRTVIRSRYDMVSGMPSGEELGRLPQNAGLRSRPT
jgi:hypothetical protein